MTFVGKKIEKKTTIIAVVAVAVVLAVGLTIKNKLSGGAPRAQMTPPVVVDTVKSQQVSMSETFIGKVEAAEKAAITARVSGFLEKITVKEGSFVKKDEILFTIEKSQYISAVRQAQAALAQAQANARNAKSTLDRNKALLESNGISQAQYDNVYAAADVATANVSAAAAALDNARLNLEYTDVRSPIAGKVGLIAYNIGEMVSPSVGVIATVIAPDPVYVLFNISEKQIQAMRHILPDNLTSAAIANIADLAIILSNGSEYSHLGKINFIDNAVDGSTDAVRIRGEFTNPEGLLAQGQTVSVSIRGRNAESRVVVPQSAIINDIGGQYVLVVDASKVVQRRNVKTGAYIGELQVVLEGVQDGEMLIIDGIQKAKPGAPVTPLTKEQYNGMVQQQLQNAAGGKK
ncbi:efflux RND transporter periplasmic adaptor subunit [Deferribacterales bacterium RsTz2092]|nr:RND transporter MFP subunit [Deferribacterales bacterium]